MAPSFGRSISFPLSPARTSKPRAAAAAYHVRSISLPCRSHPLLANLQTHTAAARAWALNPTSASPSSGLAHIDALLAALAELLLLPEPQAAVRSSAASSDRLLDAFLLLADAHRGFQEALLALRRDAADVRAALRRRDASSRLASAARSQRRTEKELARLAATVSSVAVVAASKRFTTTTAEETEMAAALVDAAAATAAASAAVFSAAASVSAAVSSSKKTATTFAAAFVSKKTETAGVEPEKLDELEQCIDECESGSEMVFRSIVRTRVSLLNIRTPAI